MLVYMVKGHLAGCGLYVGGHVSVLFEQGNPILILYEQQNERLAGTG